MTLKPNEARFEIKRENGKKSGNENAKKRWIDDIKYVSQYTVGNVQEIHGRFEI